MLFHDVLAYQLTIVLDSNSDVSCKQFCIYSCLKVSVSKGIDRDRESEMA